MFGFNVHAFIDNYSLCINTEIINNLNEFEFIASKFGNSTVENITASIL